VRQPSLILVLALVCLAPVFSQEAPRMPPEDSEAGVNALILIGSPEGTPLEGDALDRRTEEVASTIRCPQCQGLSIADSAAGTARAMKAELKDLLAAGYTAEQAMTYFEKSYGEFIRLEPKAEGFNWIVYAAPVVALLIGIALVAARLRSQTLSAPEAGEAEESESPTAGNDDLAAYRERVRREVAS